MNDSLEDAQKLVDFITPMYSVLPREGARRGEPKIALDLIPYNDIHSAAVPYRRPSREAVTAFQRHLRERGFFCGVRVTRGDDEFAACGMLATSRATKLPSSVVAT